MNHHSGLNLEGFRFASGSGAAAFFVPVLLVFPFFLFVSCERENPAEPAGIEDRQVQAEHAGTEAVSVADPASVLPEETGPVSAVSAADHALSDAPAAEKKKVRGTAAELLPKIKPGDSSYVPKSE